MEIVVKNCNNIDSATVTVDEGKLNIKFAPNGTGKSTIAKAIQYGSDRDESALAELMPFKYRDNNPDNNKPEVVGVEHIDKIMCFNENYVSQFTFKPEELVSNSFEIFIRSEEYKAAEKEIGELVLTIQQQFTNNPELETLISNLEELSGAFKLTAKGQLSKASAGMKGLSAGNKIEHIPQGLEPYEPFIRSQKSVNWIDWQAKGHKEFSELSDVCPFCSTDSEDKKEQIGRVSQEYDKNVIKNLVGIIDVVDKLGDYFSDDARDKLATITYLKDGIGKEHEAFIVHIKSQIDNLLDKLIHLRALSGFHFKEGDKVSEKLPAYKLDLEFFSILDSEKTHTAIKTINSSIDDLSKKAGLLQGKINIQRHAMRKLIERYQQEINSFLAYAGYRYKVEILGEGDGAQLKLLHIDHGQHLSGGSQHLSFGERNAFAIVLFMYECLAKKPDLIILDDPISSFDKNKKFAILYMLFRRDSSSCLKSKTVLMLTHDVEPIIDTLKSVRRQFDNQVKAAYLRFEKGEVLEQEIFDADIKTFAQICQGVFDSNCDSIIKLIYLRRYYEILDDKGDAYQVLSNLFHKRQIPVDMRESIDGVGNSPEMESGKFSAGCEAVREYIPPFDYGEILDDISNESKLTNLYKSCQNGYEKLQLFRLLGVEVENSVIQKFINETYHIENEFICQLDPSQFDLIPEYVVEECDKLVDEL